MLPNIEVKIIGDHLYLETIKESDLSFIVHWRSQPEIFKWFFNTLGVPTLEIYSKWFNENYTKDPFNYQFLIKQKESQQNIGAIALYDIEPREIAEYGRIFVISEHQRKGYANEATDLVLNFGFSCLNLKEIKLDVYADNPAVNLYMKKNFREARRYTRQEDGREVLDMLLKREDFL